MAKENLFVRSILYDFLNYDELENEIRKELKKSEESVIKSNVGGFQTPNIKNKFIGETILKKSKQLIKQNYTFKNKTNLVLHNLWINKNKKNNFNSAHTHPSSNFSGVYYLDVPEKNGELVFLENDKRSMSGLEFYLKSEEFWSECQIKPKKKMFILFPSDMLHLVKPHYEDKDRISVSFNIKLERYNG